VPAKKVKKAKKSNIHFVCDFAKKNNLNTRKKKVLGKKFLFLRPFKLENIFHLCVLRFLSIFFHKLVVFIKKIFRA